MASDRLTEAEIHAACGEIAAQGERPTSLKLYELLGRGSMSTISKYLHSWKKTDEAQALEADSLPAAVELPEELTKDSEDFIKKIWNIAKGIAEREIEIQREALRQAEKDSQARVEEAFAFSEAQAMKIDRLEEAFRALKEQFDEEYRAHRETRHSLSESEKTNVGLNKDKEQLQHEIEALMNKVAVLEKDNKEAVEERKVLQDNHATELKKKDVEIKSLDMQVHKLQMSLDSTAVSNDQLKSTLKSKESELADRVIELEKLTVHYETSLAELNTVKSDLKIANKAANDAGQQVAKLEGQLGTYQEILKKQGG